MTFFINTLLVWRYIDLESKGSTWWATIVLIDIVIYYVIFVQMLLEWQSWNNKMLKWRQDLMFEQRFRSDDDKSENKIRESIDGMLE